MPGFVSAMMRTGFVSSLRNDVVHNRIGAVNAPRCQVRDDVADEAYEAAPYHVTGVFGRFAGRGKMITPRSAAVVCNHGYLDHDM